MKATVTSRYATLVRDTTFGSIMRLPFASYKTFTLKLNRYNNEQETYFGRYIQIKSKDYSIIYETEQIIDN